MGTSAIPNAPDVLLRNDGATFTDVTTLEGISGSSQGMGDGGVWGDVDGDLQLDLYLQEGAGPASFSAEASPFLLLNKGERGNAILLDLVGRFSGAPALGAKVDVVVGGMRIHRRVQANSWRGFQDPLRVHIGIGEAAFADSVIVSWPAGLVQVYLSVPPGVWRLDENVAITSVPQMPPRPGHEWRIAGIFPQPARGTQQIRLSVGRETSLAVTVHELTGRLVRRLHGGALPAGETTLLWNGRDENGRPVSAGVYWIRAIGGKIEQSAKAVRIR
jgi:hypothetical protein